MTDRMRVRRSRSRPGEPRLPAQTGIGVRHPEPARKYRAPDDRLSVPSPEDEIVERLSDDGEGGEEQGEVLGLDARGELRAWIAGHGLTLAEFARTMGMDRRNFAGILSGKSRLTSAMADRVGEAMLRVIERGER